MRCLFEGFYGIKQDAASYVGHTKRPEGRHGVLRHALGLQSRQLKQVRTCAVHLEVRQAGQLIVCTALLAAARIHSQPHSGVTSFSHSLLLQKAGASRILGKLVQKGSRSSPLIAREGLLSADGVPTASRHAHCSRSVYTTMEMQGGPRWSC